LSDPSQQGLRPSYPRGPRRTYRHSPYRIQFEIAARLISPEGSAVLGARGNKYY